MKVKRKMVIQKKKKMSNNTKAYLAVSISLHHSVFNIYTKKLKESWSGGNFCC
jgi:hypothetical protein